MFKDQPIFGHGQRCSECCADERYATGITPCMTIPQIFIFN